jgi:hypothetical protein
MPMTFNKEKGIFLDTLDSEKGNFSNHSSSERMALRGNIL